MRTFSVKQAQDFDNFAQQVLGIPSIILMENAGRSAAEEALKMLGKKKNVVIICGMGNNGGDGLVAARHLLNAGKNVHVYMIGELAKQKPDPRTNFNILVTMGQEIVGAGGPEHLEALGQADLIIDALFGIGLQSEVRKPEAAIIKALNDAGKPILSIDVPSGLNADTGKVLGAAVKAARTVTFVAEKKGFTQAQEYCGEIIVRDIGIA